MELRNGDDDIGLTSSLKSYSMAVVQDRSSESSVNDSRLMSYQKTPQKKY